MHPADLDDALCVCALASDGTSGGETRLPFAVDGAMLPRGAAADGGCSTECGGCERAARAIGAEMQAQLDGFKSRAMRAEAPASSQQRPLYVTEWRGRRPRRALLRRSLACCCSTMVCCARSWHSR